MTYEQLVENEVLVVTDEVCVHCKEDPRRDTKYLIELPTPTRNLSIKVRVCPYCDGESLIEKAYGPRNEQEGPAVS